MKLGIHGHKDYPEGNNEKTIRLFCSNDDLRIRTPILNGVSASDVNLLSRYPAALFRSKKYNDVGHIFRLS